MRLVHYSYITSAHMQTIYDTIVFFFKTIENISYKDVLDSVNNGETVKLTLSHYASKNHINIGYIIASKTKLYTIKLYYHNNNILQFTKDGDNLEELIYHCINNSKTLKSCIQCGQNLYIMNNDNKCRDCIDKSY